MKCCIRNGRACKAHRLNDCFWGKNASSADLNDNVDNFAFFLLGRILICNRPSGGFCGAAENRALSKGVYFNDSSVNIVGKIAPVLPYPIYPFTAAVNGLIQLVRHNGKTHVLHGVKSLGVTVKVGVGAILHIKAHDVKLP